MATWEYTGLARIHFNRPDEAPRLVSITNNEHTWEVICKSIDLSNVDLVGGSDLGAPTMSPKWWLAGNVRIRVDENGHAEVRRPGT